jgi:hypothetical protein
LLIGALVMLFLQYCLCCSLLSGICVFIFNVTCYLGAGMDKRRISWVNGYFILFVLPVFRFLVNPLLEGRVLNDKPLMVEDKNESAGIERALRGSYRRLLSFLTASSHDLRERRHEIMTTSDWPRNNFV